MKNTLKKNTLSLRDREIAKFRWAMLAPGLIVLMAINLLPIADTLFTSFYDTYLPAPQDDTFVGLKNYFDLFKDPRFIASFGRTLSFMIMVIITEVVVGFGIAIFLTSHVPGTKALRSLFLLPIILTPIATAFMWRIMYSPTLGILNFFVEMFGIAPQEWIYSPEQALPSVATVVAWCKMPFMIMVFYTGLLSVSEDIIDSSRIDGASSWQQLWHIKLPLIKRVFFVAILFQTIDTAKEFDLTFILTRGGPGSATETLSVYTYLNSFGFLKMGYGSASAILLSCLIIVMAVIIIRLGGINFDE